MLASEMKQLADNIQACAERELHTIKVRIRSLAEVGNTCYEYFLKTENPEVIDIVKKNLEDEGFGVLYKEEKGLGEDPIRSLEINW